MSDRVLTILEQNYAQDTHSSQLSTPIIGGGIILLCIGIWIGRQMQRQPPSAPSKPSSMTPSGFTQALQWVSYGKEFERAEKYEDAIAVYDHGLAQHPNDFHLWHERGLAFAKLQRFEDALASFDRAYRLRPQNGDLAHERGDTLLQLERYEEAIASFNTYLRYHPDSAHILADRGYDLCQLGQFEAALQDLNRVLKMERRDRFALTHAHYYQIEALRSSRHLESALHASQLAMERYPDDHFAAQRESIRQQIAEVLSCKDTDAQTVPQDIELG